MWSHVRKLRPGRISRRGPVLLAVALVALSTVSCSSKKGPAHAPDLAPRTYRMGFSWFPPRPDIGLALQTIDAWQSRADAALIVTEPPWDSLLAGRRADSLVRANQLGLADLYRARGLRVIVSIDPTNGLDHSSDAASLVAAGRSLTEPAVQALYRSLSRPSTRSSGPTTWGSPRKRI